MTQVQAELQRLLKIVVNPSSTRSAELVAEEIAYRLGRNFPGESDAPPRVDEHRLDGRMPCPGRWRSNCDEACGSRPFYLAGSLPARWTPYLRLHPVSCGRPLNIDQPAIADRTVRQRQPEGRGQLRMNRGDPSASALAEPRPEHRAHRLHRQIPRVDLVYFLELRELPRRFLLLVTLRLRWARAGLCWVVIKSLRGLVRHLGHFLREIDPFWARLSSLRRGVSWGDAGGMGRSAPFCRIHVLSSQPGRWRGWKTGGGPSCLLCAESTCLSTRIDDDPRQPKLLSLRDLLGLCRRTPPDAVSAIMLLQA